MPSTGTASFSRTRDQMIAASLRVLRVLSDGASPGTNDLTICSEALNILLKQMMSTGLPLWCYQLLPIPMVAGQNTYTLGPAPADVVCNRPLRMFEGSYIRTVCGTQTFDTQLRMISLLEYLQFGGKQTLSVPNSIMFMPLIDTGTPFAGGTTSPSTGHAAVQVYATPQDGTRTIYANMQRQIFDMTTGTDEFDLPVENFQWLKYQLAAEVADEYNVPEQRLARIEQKAKFYKDEMFAWSVETVSMMMQPDQQVYQRR